MCSQVVLPPPSGQKKDTVTADSKECTMLFSFFPPSFIHHIVPHHKYFFSNNSVTKEAVIFPLIHYFRLPLRQEPLKASEQLLVSCNGLPLPDVVFTPRPQRQFALWPQLTEHIHQLHCQPTWVTLGEPQRDQKHFSSLLYSTTNVEDSPAVLQKKKKKQPLVCISPGIAQEQDTLSFGGISGTHSRQDSYTRYWWWNKKKRPPVFWAGVKSARTAAHLPANCANTSPTTSSPPTTLSCFNFPSVHKSLILLLPLMLTEDSKKQIAEQLKNLRGLSVYCKQWLLLPMWMPKDLFSDTTARKVTIENMVLHCICLSMSFV